MKTIQKSKCVKIFFLSIILVITGCFTDKSSSYLEEIQESQNPKQVLESLIAGNKRFLSNSPLHRDDLQMKGATASKLGQSPEAVILACMDSRSIPEIVFDQSVGDIFTLRVAGNIINKEMLGSLEYATKYVGSKLIVVLGHTQCGAVEAACKGVQGGKNLSSILNAISPAVDTVASQSEKNCSDTSFVTKIAWQNVRNMMQLILQQSPIIAELVANKEVAIVGAMHDLASGVVNFESTENSV